MTAGPGELFDLHLDFADRIASHYMRRFRSLARHADDTRQIARMALWEAALSYQPDRGATFATWAGRRINGALVDELRRGFEGIRIPREEYRQDQPKIAFVGLRDRDSETPSVEEEIYRKQISAGLRGMIDRLIPTHRKMLELVLVEGKTGSAAAEQLGIHQSNWVHARNALIERCRSAWKVGRAA